MQVIIRNLLLPGNTFLSLKPDTCEAWNSKGTALCKTGSNEDAIDAYDNASRLKLIIMKHGTTKVMPCLSQILMTQQWRLMAKLKD